MKNYKLTVILCTIGIILISVFMLYSTYAYFTVDVHGEGEKIELTTFDKNTTIIYKDTSNVSMVNAYTGEEIIKTFTVENTSELLLYYDILLNNVINNFENKNDLVFTLECNNILLRDKSIMPSTNESIASDIIIKPHEKHEYKMTITFLNKETDQSANMNKTFSSNILVSGSKNINVGEIIYKDNTLLKEIMTKYEIEDSNIFKTNSSLDGKPVYYYKGKDINNNLIYKDMCFKIIRTDENYGIRIIYNGEYIDGVCSNETTINKGKFNLKSNSNAYIGYVFGNAGSNNYNNEHTNINDSNIKTILDTWYKEKLTTANVSKNTIFCNNRQTNAFTLHGVFYGTNGYNKLNTGYYDINNGFVSFSCPNENDRFSLNHNLNYPVGLITADEVLFSGEDSYLYNDSYWTMTPAYFDGSDAYNYVVNKNKLVTSKVTNDFGIKPVISLDKNILLESGDGSIESPYIVK